MPESQALSIQDRGDWRVKAAWSPDGLTHSCGGLWRASLGVDELGGGEQKVVPEKGLPHIHDELQSGRTPLGTHSPPEGTVQGHTATMTLPHGLTGKEGDSTSTNCNK